MTGRERIKCSADHFLALLNLPRCEFENDREHRLHFWEVFEAQLHVLMDPTMVGAMLGNVAWKTKKILLTRNDLSMEMHSNEGDSVSTYPRRP
jgi:hypothetical protein